MNKNTIEIDKVSVVIVTYRRPDYLKIAVQSILNQTYKNTEVIIVSDGHDIEVQEYVSSLKDSNIMYFYVDHCGYPAKGRNLGIEKSNGSFIAFCDDDDIWLPEKLEKQVNILNSNITIGLCCTNRCVIDINGKELDVHKIRWVPKHNSLDDLLLSNFISYSSVIIRKEILERTGVFIDDIRFKAIEDYHLWLRIAFFYKISFLNEKLILYRMHSSNISGRLSEGAKKNILLYNDLFRKYNFKRSKKLKAKFIGYLKFSIYKIANK